MFDANSIAKSILTSGQNLQTLNPRQIGILATDPATKGTQIGLSAEDWINTAPATWWTGWDKPNPTAIWDSGGNPTPLPKTGASLLNPIYDPVPGYVFKPPASAAYEPGRYMSGTGGTTDVVQPVTAPTEQLPAMTEIEQKPVQAHMRQDSPEQPAFDLDQVLTDIEGLINANTPQSLQLARRKYEALLAQQPNLEYGTFEDYLKTTAGPPPVIETVEQPVVDVPVADDADETVVADFTLRNDAVKNLDAAIDAGNRDLAQTLFTNLITEFPDYVYAGRPQDPVTTHFTPGTLESYMVGAGKTFPPLADDTVVDDTTIADTTVADDAAAVAEVGTTAVTTLTPEMGTPDWDKLVEIDKGIETWAYDIANQDAYNQAASMYEDLMPGYSDLKPFKEYVQEQLNVAAGPGGFLGSVVGTVWDNTGGYVVDQIETAYNKYAKPVSAWAWDKVEKGTGWLKDQVETVFSSTAADWIEELAEYGQYIDPTGILFAADKVFDAWDVAQAIRKGQLGTALLEAMALYGPVKEMFGPNGELLKPAKLYGDLKDGVPLTKAGWDAAKKMLGAYVGKTKYKVPAQVLDAISTDIAEWAGLGRYEEEDDKPTEVATTNGLVVSPDTDYGAESMADYFQKRRDYYEQYEAQPLLAQSEQQRTAIGQLRGQMMAKQGLMGSPLAVGLGVQQEAQMRGLAMQEVGRGRAAMELQLSEQAFRQRQIDTLASEQRTKEIRETFANIASEIGLWDWLKESAGPVVINIINKLAGGDGDDIPGTTIDMPGGTVGETGLAVITDGDKPVVEKPVVEKPVVEKPVVEKPVTEGAGDVEKPETVERPEEERPPGAVYEIEPRNPLWPQGWSPSMGRLYGVNGTPTPQDVLVALENIQNFSGGDPLSLADSVNALVTGFSLGDPTKRTEAITGMISDLGNMTNTLGPVMSWQDVQDVVDKWLTGKEYGQAVPTDAGQGNLQGVEDYRTAAHAVATEIFGHPDHHLSDSLVTPGQPFDTYDVVHINNVANAVIDGEESLSTLRDLVVTLQSQLTNLNNKVSPLDSQKETAEENGALQPVPLTGSAIGEAQNLLKEIEGLVDKIGFNHLDSRTIVPGRSGTLKIFDLVYSGSVLTEVLEGKRDIQDLYEIRDDLSRQTTKAGTDSWVADTIPSGLSTATLGIGSTSEDATSNLPLVVGGVLRDTHANLYSPGSTIEVSPPDGNGTNNGLGGSTAADMVGEAVQSNPIHRGLTENPNTANEGDLAQRVENMKGNRASNLRTGTGKEKEMSKEERLKNIGVMVRLAMDTNDKDLLFTAKSMHRILKNKYPNLVEWDIFFDQAGSPAMAALLVGDTNQPQYNVRT